MKHSLRWTVSRAINTPFALEWKVSAYIAGLGLLLALIGPGALTRPIEVSVSPWFDEMTRGFGVGICVCGLFGLWATWHRRRLMRASASIAACIALGWLMAYYILSVPLDPVSIFNYSIALAAEVVVYWRTAANIDHYWS